MYWRSILTEDDSTMVVPPYSLKLMGKEYEKFVSREARDRLKEHASDGGSMGAFYQYPPEAVQSRIHCALQSPSGCLLHAPVSAPAPAASALDVLPAEVIQEGKAFTRICSPPIKDPVRQMFSIEVGHSTGVICPVFKQISEN